MGDPGTRARLLDAAVAVMAEDGWAAATSRVVAERAGVNNALVHYYFGTVDQLRRDAVKHALERELDAPMTAIFESKNALDGILDAVAVFITRDPGSAGQRVMAEAMVQGLRDEVLRAESAVQIRMFRELLAGRLAADQEAGLLRADADPVALADMVAALMDGLLLHALADPGFDAGAPTAALIALLRPNDPTTE